MSIGFSLPTTFVDSFSSQMWYLSQQKMSRLMPHVSVEPLKGEYKFFDRIAPTDVELKAGRNSDTVLSDIDWSRRRVSMNDYVKATLVDAEDKLRLIHSPESEISRVYQMAYGRKIDEIIIGSALGTAYAGRNGNTAVELADANKLGASDGAAFSALNVETLRRIKKYFWENEAVDPDSEMLCMAVGASDLISLLREQEVTSQDYNTVRALVDGKLDTFMGIKFVRLELLPDTTAAIQFNPSTGEVDSTNAGNPGFVALPQGARRCFAFTKDAIRMARGRNVEVKIEPRADKNYSNQVYSRMSLGGVRMEEAKVLEVFTLKA